VYGLTCRLGVNSTGLPFNSLSAVERSTDGRTNPMEPHTRQCCLRVSAIDLAVMGATLADGGLNPVTGEQVIDPGVCHHTLAVMLTAGLYESCGEWLYDVGLPAKGGISGGIVMVPPAKGGGMGTFAPPLDRLISRPPGR
jgi:glutaminase